MPRVFRIGPYLIYFYAADRTEPRHVHVKHDRAGAKFCLDLDVRLDKHRGFSDIELGRITRLVTDRADELRAVWDHFFR